MSAQRGRTPRFVIWQLGASALVLALLFVVPIAMLLDQQAAQRVNDGAFGAQVLALQQISRQTEAIVRAGPSAKSVRRLHVLVRRARANERRVITEVAPQSRHAFARDFENYVDGALRIAAIPDGALYRRMLDREMDMLQTLATAEQQHFARGEKRSRFIFVLIACGVAALVALLVSGWRALYKASWTEDRLRERVADANEDDVQLARMEELYLIIASAGPEPAVQMQRALAFASQSLSYEWAATVEWSDGEDARVSAVLGDYVPSLGGCKLEKAVALESSRLGRPVTFRIDRLPPALAPLLGAQRPFPWRHCVAYTFPGDNRDGVPHCALFLGARAARPDTLSNADRQLLRLVGTLVSASSRNARHQKRLDDLAFADALTGLPNRAHLNEQLEEAIENADRSGRSFAIHYVDLDGFKSVNDQDGHAVGDEVLKVAAMRMAKVLRQEETIARIGGDEFVVLQTSADSAHDAAEVAQRIIERLSRPFVVGGRKYTIGGSVGIAMYPENGLTATDLLRHADMALYASKRGGKGRASFFSAAPPTQDGTSNVA
ncbi:MAG: GGDEF domain-containing protein [Candidatus Eremiobacteraeota bacterium]|nr:GGDEF domain-containing protein [Candidatus Eremiobacteraeota bacterium]